MTRLPCSPLMIRVPGFLLFGFTNGTPTEKGKRALLGSLDDHILPPGMITCIAAILNANI